MYTKIFLYIFACVFFVQACIGQQSFTNELQAFVCESLVMQRSQEFAVTVDGESFNLKRLWHEEPWVTKAACIKSAYKYLAQRNEPPSPQAIKDIFASCFRFFHEEDPAYALVNKVYNLSCVVLKYSKEGSMHFLLAQQAAMNAARLLMLREPAQPLWKTCAEELPYWGAMCMACLTGITLRRPIIHTAMHLCGTKKDFGFVGDIAFSMVTAGALAVLGVYIGYIQAKNKMLSFKNDAYEQNNASQPDANGLDFDHTEQELVAIDVVE